MKCVQLYFNYLLILIRMRYWDTSSSRTEAILREEVLSRCTVIPNNHYPLQHHFTTPVKGSGTSKRASNWVFDCCVDICISFLFGQFCFSPLPLFLSFGTKHGSIFTKKKKSGTPISANQLSSQSQWLPWTQTRINKWFTRSHIIPLKCIQQMQL